MPLVTVLVLAAQASGAGADVATLQRRVPAACAVIRVTAPGLARQPRDLVFSSRAVLDLRLEAHLRRPLRGDHLLRFKVLTPGGFLYQVMTVPFADATGGDQSATRMVPGQARPVLVQRLVPVEGADGVGSYAVSAALPVAGTSITQSSLYGRWTVEPYLDDEAAACGPATRFTIRE